MKITSDILKPKDGETFDDYALRIAKLKDNIEKATWTTIAKLVAQNTGVEKSADCYRKRVKRTESTPAPKKDFQNEKVTINYDRNETTSSKEIPLTHEQLTNPSELLKAHGYNPDEWTIKTATNSQTNRTTIKGDSCIYTSRIVIKPKEGEPVTYESIDNYFTDFNKHKYNALSINPMLYDPEGEFLEVCIQDLHLGLLAYEPETGEDYNINIGKKRLENCVADIISRCKGQKFKRIVLVFLGDILHIDNWQKSTTKGTTQDVDTRPTKIFDEALSALIEVILRLGKIAPIEVVNVTGNHDTLTGYMLCKSLEMAFLGDDKVTFFNSPNPRKWRRYGKVLIGFSHGDMKPNAVSEWLANECNEWSDAKYREVHLGHLHSLQTIQRIEDNKYGLIARYLPAICASSAWEHSMGYPKSQRGVMSFVWNENTGLREIWYSNI